MFDEKSFQKRMERIEILTQEVENLPDENSRAKAIELVQLLMEYHGAAVGRMMEVISQSKDYPKIFDELAGDELAASLLMLYGLHPADVRQRVENALEQVRPLLKSHGGDAELLGVENGVVRLNLIGSCNGCPSSSETLKNAIEGAIYEFAPDVAEIKVENEKSLQNESSSAGNLVQIVGLNNAPNNSNGNQKTFANGI